MSIPTRGQRASHLAYDGGDKLYYVRETTQSISPAYLRALLTWTDHKQPVLPFRTDAYYASIMSGQPWVPRRKGDFKLEAADLNTVAKAKRQRKAKANVAAAKPLSPQEPGVQAEENGDGEAQVDVNAEPTESEPSPAASEKESEESDSASGPSSSNSRSSSTSSAASSSSSASAPAAAVPAASAAPEPAAPASDIGGQASGSGELRGGRLAEETFFWREFKFTKTWKQNLAAKGWEVACPYHSNCRRNRSAAKFGGMDRLTLVLKTWCVSAAACVDGPDGGQAHMDMSDEEPMLEDSLEDVVLPPLDVQRAVKRRRRTKASA